MFRTAFLLVAIVGMASVGCKKETIIGPGGNTCCDTIFSYDYDADTVYPSEYLMAYPGSWWRYSDGSIDSCYSWEVTPIYSVSSEGDSVFVDTDLKTLPKVRYKGKIGHVKNGVFIRTYHDLLISSGTFLVQEEVEVLINSTSEGDAYPTGIEIHTRRLEVVDHFASMEVHGIVYFDVIHVHDHRSVYFSSTGGGPSTTINNYFARNVGLISSYRSASTTTERHLVDYHIE